MAVTSVILDIRANTNRALADFKKFSSQLDNKFLVSGLKLDVVRSALGQINREFQKAIGEQGLQAGQSLRAAQNQAALLGQTFRDFSSEASMDITKQFSEAFSSIAVAAGGTSEDIKKSLGAVSFISQDIPKELRDRLAEGIFEFQRDFRRAGLSDNFAQIITQFISGQVTAQDLINSGDSTKTAIGKRLSLISGTQGPLATARERSEAAAKLVTDPELIKSVREMAKNAYGFKAIIEDLNSYLFNPEKGVFGALREVSMSVADKTTVFDETKKLVDSVFGRQGFFLTFFEQIRKIFGIEDPLKVVINGIRWLTRQFNRLIKFLESPMVQSIVSIAEKTIQGVVDFFTKIYNKVSGYVQSDEGQESVTKVTTFFTNLFKSVEEFYDSDKGKVIQDYAKRAIDNVTGLFKAVFDTVSAGDWNPEKIQGAIKQIGTDVRAFIRKIGQEFRDLDIKKQGNFVLDIVGTLVEEIARTIGAVISEGIKTVFSGKGLSVIAGLITIVNEALTGFFSEIFGDGPGGIIGAIGTAAIAAAFGKKIALAIIRFGARLIAALPGGAAINASINRRTSRAVSGMASSIGGALSGLGRRVARQLARIPGLGNLVPSAWTRDPSRVTRRGMTSVFEKAVVTYLRAIQRCVCTPGFGGGIDGGIGGTSRGRRRGGRGPTGPGTVGRTDRRIITPVTQYSRPIGPAIGPDGGRGFPINGPIPPRPVPRQGFGSRISNFGRGLINPYNLSAAPGYVDMSNGNVAARFNRRYGGGGHRAILGRDLRGRGGRLGFGALSYGLGAYTLASILGGGPANASQDLTPEEQKQLQDSKRQQAGTEILGMAGGAIGGTIGTAIAGPVGTVIGGMLGDMAGRALASMPFMRPITERLGKFAEDTIKWIGAAWEKIKKGFGVVTQFFTRDLPELFNRGFVLLTKEIPGKLLKFGQDLGKNMLDSVSNFNLGDVLRNTWEGIKNSFSGNNEGVNYFGPTLSKEAMMSGGNPRVVNDREFVIPRDGFPILADAVSNKLSLQKKERSSAQISATFNVAISVNGGLGTNNVEELRGPVLEIIEDAWKMATSGTVERGTTVI